MITWSMARWRNVEYRATTGFMPPVAKPLARPTACSSAMPASTKRSGNSSANASRPVPPFMAAVMATMRSSRRASAANALPNTLVYEGAADGFFFTSPVAISNGAMPWNFSGFCTAGA